MIQVYDLGKANGGSFQKNKGEASRKWLCNTHLNLLSFDIIWLFYCNLYFLFAFLLKSLLSLLFYWNLYFLFTSLLKFWNLYVLFTFLLKSLLSLYYSIQTSTHICPCATSAPALHCEKQSCLASPKCLHHICTSITLRISIMPSFPQCNYAPHVCLHHICTSITLRKAIMPCFPQCNYAHKIFKEKLCPPCHAARRRTRAGTAPYTVPHTTSFRDPVHSDLLWKHGDLHTSLLSNLQIVPRLPHKVPPLDWATSELADCDSTTWLRYCEL